MLTLSQKDKEVLQKVINRYKILVDSRPIRSEVLPLDGDARYLNTTDIYIAKAPSGGLPALSGDTPGEATCDIYRVNATGPTLEAITDLDKVVYNIGSAIDEDEYFVVGKTKSGRWVPTGGTGENMDIKVKVTSSDTGGGFLEEKIAHYNGFSAAEVLEAEDIHMHAWTTTEDTPVAGSNKTEIFLDAEGLGLEQGAGIGTNVPQVIVWLDENPTDQQYGAEILPLREVLTRIQGYNAANTQVLIHQGFGEVFWVDVTECA